ncbi:hypothetical protein [Streptomyces sp. NPDC051994]|uniref:hypothetical protein n=1 Tax=unclassified Streptomyces TaxID=2593676 RepID=UPI00342D4E66
MHWQRRLTDSEFADYLHAEQTRREQIILLSDPQLPPPDLGPLPTEADCTRAVNACINHAISQDAASLVHAKNCTAPDSAKLPGCNCTPEPTPTPEPEPEPQQLPPGWS